MILLGRGSPAERKPVAARAAPPASSRRGPPERCWRVVSRRNNGAGRKALGSLATDKNNNRPLRETLRVFLETGGSYVAAAEALNLHRNTVQYRLRKGRELLPTPIA